MSVVLAIAPHPDDETLGCGGTLLKHRDEKDEVYWLIVTNINESDGWKKKKVEKRQKEIIKVSNAYRFKDTFKLDYPSTKLDNIPLKELIESISKIITKIKANIIYAPNGSDIHSDHQIAFKAIVRCTKNFRSPFVKKILSYECLSETELAPALYENIFIPNVFVNITNYLKRKIEIMKLYESEIMPFPHPRSQEVIESLAKLRGSRIGSKYAEAFMLIEERI